MAMAKSNQRKYRRKENGEKIETEESMPSMKTSANENLGRKKYRRKYSKANEMAMLKWRRENGIIGNYKRRENNEEAAWRKSCRRQRQAAAAGGENVGLA
jgi:hypothetical protein